VWTELPLYETRSLSSSSSPKISILLSKFFHLLSYQFLEITPRWSLFKIQQNLGAWKQERRRQEIQSTMHTWKVNGIRMNEQNFWYHFVVNSGLWNCTNLMSVFSSNRRLYLHLRVGISGNFALVGSCQLNSIQFRGSRKKRLIHPLSNRLYGKAFDSLKKGTSLVTRWSV